MVQTLAFFDVGGDAGRDLLACGDRLFVLGVASVKDALEAISICPVRAFSCNERLQIWAVGMGSAAALVSTLITVSTSFCAGSGIFLWPSQSNDETKGKENVERFHFGF